MSVPFLLTVVISAPLWLWNEGCQVCADCSGKPQAQVPRHSRRHLGPQIHQRCQPTQGNLGFTNLSQILKQVKDETGLIIGHFHLEKEERFFLFLHGHLRMHGLSVNITEDGAAGQRKDRKIHIDGLWMWWKRAYGWMAVVTHQDLEEERKRD